jgi:hypothetical protein
MQETTNTALSLNWQDAVDDVVAIFYARIQDSFPEVLKAMVSAAKRYAKDNNLYSPTPILRDAFSTIISLYYESEQDDGNDATPDDKTLGNIILLMTDGLLEDVVDTLLTEDRVRDVKVWAKNLAARLCTCFRA